MSDREQYPSGDFAELASSELCHWWFRGRNQIIVDAVQRHCKAPKSILEVGCGTGFVLQALAEAYPAARIEAAELHPEGIRIAQRRVPRAIFRELDVRSMHDTDAYDVLGAFDVLEHIEQDGLVVGNLARALKTGGHLIVTVPQHQFLWSAFDEQACHVRRYDRKRLLDLFRGAGLQVVQVTSFVSLLLPIMLLARRRAANPSYRPIDEFRVHPVLNAGFRMTLAIEQAIIALGGSWPLGGSLLMVGRKP